LDDLEGQSVTASTVGYPSDMFSHIVNCTSETCRKSEVREMCSFAFTFRWRYIL